MADSPTFGQNAPLRGRLIRDESMARHVSWRAGGRADQIYLPADVADLQAFLATLPSDEKVCFVGLGSNLLVRDGGYRGTVVLMHSTHAAARLDNGLFYADAGLAAPKLARLAATRAMEGAEFLAGVPGTIGGALAMNAGCYGSETWNHVVRVLTVSHRGILRERESADFNIGYRHCALKIAQAAHGEGDEWFVGAWFRFSAGDSARARQRIKELLSARIASQPLELPNAGSVFRNPPGDFAARLIEACGLKGVSIGGAQVSAKHANFIVNPSRRASAGDIEALITLVRNTVRSRFDVDLVPEVRIVGDERAPGGGGEA